MPVRKIPKNHLFVTGGYSSRKNEEMDAFESLLEKDYLMLLDFDDAVEKFEVQPVRVPVVGVPRGYVPDVLVFYHPDVITGAQRCPELIDVKNSAELQRNFKKYERKFEAAQTFAADRGWEFKIVDESQIRGPRLANLKFLREYRNVVPVAEDIAQVLDLIGDEVITSDSLLRRLATSDEDRLYWLPVIWAMLLSKHLHTDLDRSFSSVIPLQRAGVLP